MTIGGDIDYKKPSIKPINTGKLSTAHMVNQGQGGGNQPGGNQPVGDTQSKPGGNQQGGNQPVGDTQPKPDGGYLKFRCMY